MRRRLLYTLLLVCLLLPSGYARAGEAVPADQAAVQVDYEGNWYWFEDFQFGLLLPAAWQPVAAEGEIYFMAADPGGKQAMWLELYGIQGYSMDTLLEGLTALPQFTQVEGVYQGGVPFVRYLAPQDNLLGYATLAAEEQLLLFFKFTPADVPALAALATQVMTTVSPVDRAEPQEP